MYKCKHAYILYIYIYACIYIYTYLSIYIDIYIYKYKNTHTSEAPNHGSTRTPFLRCFMYTGAVSRCGSIQSGTSIT